MHDILPPAAFIMKGCLDNIGKVQSLMYWTFTDIFEEKGGGETPFHGGFGMINFQGIVKPSFHAYRMLNQLGDEKLYYSDALFVSRSSSSGKITAVAYNYPKEYEDAVPSTKNFNNYMDASSKNLDFTLYNLKPDATFMIEVLGHDHGNAYEVYKQLGSPRSLSITETMMMKEKSWETEKAIVNADNYGTIAIKRTMSPWTCILIKEL